MNQLIEPRRANLLLHCGARHITRDALDAVATPAATPTWTPVAHTRILRIVETELAQAGLTVIGAAHGLTHDGARYFGLLQVSRTTNAGDVCFVVGLRNSHDKSLPAGLVAGSQVFVCDNLAFSGQIILHRKHTRHILEYLPILARKAVGILGDLWTHETHRIETYKAKTVSRNQAHDLIIRALDARVCTATQIPAIVAEWRKPRHADFEPRTLWSLHNAFTETLKGNLPALADRTQRLTRLFDTVADIPAAKVALN